MSRERLFIDASGRVLAVGAANKETTAMMPDREYSNDERLLLEWLSKEESSALGECFAKPLWHLLGEGLVEVDPVEGKSWGYARVSLTPEGWAVYKALSP